MIFAITNPPTLGSKEPEYQMITIKDYIKRQRIWSERTFGPGDRTAGIIDHIQKELLEIEDDPDDLMEWVDVIILGFDGLWRALAYNMNIHDPSPDDIGAVVCDLMEQKYFKNEARQWPDWRTAKTDKAIEHVRTDDEQKPTGRSDKPSVDALTFLRQCFNSALVALQDNDYKIISCPINEAAIKDVEAGLRRLDEMERVAEQIDQLFREANKG